MGQQWLTWLHVLINLQVSRDTSVVRHWYFRYVHKFSSVTLSFEIPSSESRKVPKLPHSLLLNPPIILCESPCTCNFLFAKQHRLLYRSVSISRLNCSNKSEITCMFSSSVLLASRSKYYDETGWIIIAATRRPWHWPWYRIAPNCTSSFSRSLTVHVYRTSTQSFHSTNQTKLAIFRPSDLSFIIYPCNAKLLHFYHVLNTEQKKHRNWGATNCLYTRGYALSAHFHHTPSGEWNTKHCIPYFPSMCACVLFAEELLTAFEWL